jgi:hypothetical protein
MRYPDNEGGYIRGHRAAPRKVFTIEKQAFRESPAPGANDHLLPIEPTGVRYVLIKLNELGAMIQPTQAIATTRDAMRSHSAEIAGRAMKIYATCNFRDLTGQRIMRVCETLHFVEGRVDRMAEIWGGLDKLNSVMATEIDALH